LDEILPLDLSYSFAAAFMSGSLKGVVNTPLVVQLKVDLVAFPCASNDTLVVTGNVIVEATKFTMFSVTSNLDDSQKKLLQVFAKVGGIAEIGMLVSPNVGSRVHSTAALRSMLRDPRSRTRH
jgi:hypothetical protein